MSSKFRNRIKHEMHKGARYAREGRDRILCTTDAMKRGYDQQKEADNGTSGTSSPDHQTSVR